MTVIDEARGVDVSQGSGPLPDGVLPLLDAWLPGRRWYPVPGEGVHHVPWLTVTFPVADGDPAAEVVVPLLRLSGPGLPAPDDEGALVIQVPLVLRPAVPDAGGGSPGGRSPGGRPAGGPQADPADGHPELIGVVGTPGGAVAVYDGGTDPVAWRAYLTASLPAADGELRLDGAHPLGGEQSNTSVIVPGLRPPVPGSPNERADGVILKILRTVPLGPHPDVVIPEALTRAGWDGVPRYLGSVALPEPTAHLGVVAELITDADDGFELACAHASEGMPFDEEAATLGAVVAHMHIALAAARPTAATLEPAGFMGVLRRRAAEAIADVRDLAPHRAGITAFYDEVSDHLAAVTADHPIPLQTIHGDLHLGQVLHGANGWKVLDFEGEPQRPVAERTAPDLPLRDVAGLLRSFDYAAAVGGTTDPEWSADAQLSFLEGYREALTGDRPAFDVTTSSLLLRALTLDKALYEVVYESLHRPHWLYIPLTAVRRTLSA